MAVYTSSSQDLCLRRLRVTKKGAFLCNHFWLRQITGFVILREHFWSPKNTVCVTQARAFWRWSRHLAAGQDVTWLNLEKTSVATACSGGQRAVVIYTKKTPKSLPQALGIASPPKRTRRYPCAGSAARGSHLSDFEARSESTLSDRLGLGISRSWAHPFWLRLLLAASQCR